MLTKVQYDYLKHDKVLPGVWDTIVKESPMIQRLSFMEVGNDIVKYNVETSMPTVSWLDQTGAVSENTGTFEQRTTNVYTLGGDADTNKAFIKMNPLQNPETTDIEAKSKAMAHSFEYTLVNGQTTAQSNSNEFKGLMRIIAELESSSTTDLDAANNSQVIAESATTGALEMVSMDALIDQIRPGKPDALLMGRRARRKLNVLARASGSSGLGLMELKDYGMFVETYDGIPLFINDWIPENIADGASSIATISAINANTARADGYDNTVIFAMKIGENDVTGLQAGGMTHERETFIEGFNVIRNRFTWNVSAMCKKKYSLACLINMNPDD
uniref:Putative capsid protein n=1 Tax=viral metagenome TaxID=1070528 RepID=A0A6M3KUP9_9ZZZZ